MIKLSAKEMLPIIREAFDNKSLQMFKDAGTPKTPTYAGPCAVGICFSEEERAKLDSYTLGSGGCNIKHIVESDGAECDDVVELHDLRNLQNNHDAACFAVTLESSEYHFGKFEAQLKKLEGMYL